MAEGAMGYLWDLFYKKGNPTMRGFPSWRDCEKTHLLRPPPRSNTDAVWASSAVPRCMYTQKNKKTKNSGLHKNVHMCFYNSNIHSNQSVETVQIKRQMNE